MEIPHNAIGSSTSAVIGAQRHAGVKELIKEQGGWHFLQEEARYIPISKRVT